MFLEASSVVARRYAPPQLPHDSHQVMRCVSQRFRNGIGLIGREARTIASIIASRMLLPFPLHSCIMSFSHTILLLYAFDLSISHSLWRALAAAHTLLVHLITEFAEQGCTKTLYFHGFSHVWFGDCIPIHFGDEAREADLRLAKTFAPLTSTEPTTSIEDGWKHELYTNFRKAKTKGTGAWFWLPIWQPIIVE